MIYHDQNLNDPYIFLGSEMDAYIILSRARGNHGTHWFFTSVRSLPGSWKAHLWTCQLQRWADTANLSLKVACRKLEVASGRHMAAVPLTCCNQIENLFGSIWANQHHTLLSAILGSAFVNVQSPTLLLVFRPVILIANTAIMSSCFLYAFDELIPPVAFLCPFLVLRPKAPADLSNP